jgi:hypothetical protein
LLHWARTAAHARPNTSRQQAAARRVRCEFTTMIDTCSKRWKWRPRLPRRSTRSEAERDAPGQATIMPGVADGRGRHHAWALLPLRNSCGDSIDLQRRLAVLPAQAIEERPQPGPPHEPPFERAPAGEVEQQEPDLRSSPPAAGSNGVCCWAAVEEPAAAASIVRRRLMALRC